MRAAGARQGGTLGCITGSGGSERVIRAAVCWSDRGAGACAESRSGGQTHPSRPGCCSWPLRYVVVGWAATLWPAMDACMAPERRIGSLH